MLIQLTDKALTTILKKTIDPGLPDIAFFKRPVTLEFKNILGNSPAFERSFLRYFETVAAQTIAEQLKKESLRLHIEEQKEGVSLKLYQSQDLQVLAPDFFVKPHPYEFIYLDVLIGKSLKIHYCALAEDKEKILGLTQIFILIAYDTLNHLKKPTELVLKTNEANHRYKESSNALNDKKLSEADTRTQVYHYFQTKHYIYERKVTNVSSRPIHRAPDSRYYIKPEWERRGHWRTYVDKDTGLIKKRTWIEPQHIKISEEKLRKGPNRVIRVASI